MTDKELRKLRRHDLLELLVEQSREAARLGAELKEKEEELSGSEENNGRLKAKLDEKDELIEKLKRRLDEKDAEMAQKAAGIEETLERLKLKLNEKDASMSEEAARMKETFDRLKHKLDDKDALIEKLRSSLDSREKKIETLEAEMADLRSGRWKELQKSGLPEGLLSKLKGLL